MTTRYELMAIGHVRSAVQRPEEAPRQGRDAGITVEVEVDPRYEGALHGIERWERIQVICWLDRASRDILAVQPGRDPTAPLTGVFATRSPSRPNPLAVYAVDLLARRGNVLVVRGVDAVDGTPVVDIRPYRSRLDD